MAAYKQLYTLEFDRKEMKKNTAILIALTLVTLLWIGCEKEPEPAGTALQFISGQNQSGFINLELSDSVIVRVFDQNGMPFTGYEIVFRVDSSSFGQLSSAGQTADSLLLTTDSLGFARALWTLGNTVGTQTITIVATALSGSPLVVSATGIPWMQDSRDGKYYRTVDIGTQVWMAENLNYETNSSFVDSSFPAAVYGRFYTWIDANMICPSGWHLPSDVEWSTLENSLGGNAVGSLLKSIDGWNFGYGNNLSGMNIYPAGQMNPDSSFSNLTSEASLWTSTQTSVDTVWRRKLVNGSTAITKGLITKDYGLSCRCLQD